MDTSARTKTDQSDTPKRKRGQRGPGKPRRTIDPTLPVEMLPAQLTTNDVAAYMGGISTRTVRAWILEGLIRASKPVGKGGTVLIPRTELVRLLAA